MIVTLDTLSQLDFAKGDALIPAVVQHAHTGEVLMVAWMNDDALRKTLRHRRATFWSRSRGQLWQKGETSGNILEVLEIKADCDRDTLLVRALPTGPVCHTGAPTCFGAPTGFDTPTDVDTRDASSTAVGFLAELEHIIGERVNENPEKSYTAKLLQSGVQRIAQKVGEEGVELALAATAGQRKEIVGEAADLLYHLLVLLRSRELSLADVEQELLQRHAKLPNTGQLPK